MLHGCFQSNSLNGQDKTGVKPASSYLKLTRHERRKTNPCASHRRLKMGELGMI